MKKPGFILPYLISMLLASLTFGFVSVVLPTLIGFSSHPAPVAMGYFWIATFGYMYTIIFAALGFPLAWIPFWIASDTFVRHARNEPLAFVFVFLIVGMCLTAFSLLLLYPFFARNNIVSVFVELAIPMVCATMVAGIYIWRNYVYLHLNLSID